MTCCGTKANTEKIIQKNIGDEQFEEETKEELLPVVETKEEESKEENSLFEQEPIIRPPTMRLSPESQEFQPGNLFPGPDFLGSQKKTSSLSAFLTPKTQLNSNA